MGPIVRLLEKPNFPLNFRDTVIMARGTAASFVKGLTGLLMLQTAVGNPVKSGQPYSTGAPAPSLLKHGHLGAVASEAEVCSHIGIELLKKGGNAADAMVGTVACVGVIGMYHSGKLHGAKIQHCHPVY